MTDLQKLAAAEAELLSVYRELTRITHDRDNAVLLGLRIADELEKEHAASLTQEARIVNERRIHEADREGWHKTFRQYDEDITRCDFEISELHRATDACLDLIGEVVKDEAFLDSMAGSLVDFAIGHSDPMVVQDVQQQIVKAGGFLVMDEVDVEAAGPMPARCLSCNADKDGFYLCTICFELNLDHSCELFEELQDAWNEGKRDFPRPGKNAKEMYKK